MYNFLLNFLLALKKINEIEDSLHRGKYHDFYQNKYKMIHSFNIVLLIL